MRGLFLWFYPCNGRNLGLSVYYSKRREKHDRRAAWRHGDSRQDNALAKYFQRRPPLSKSVNSGPLRRISQMGSVGPPAAPVRYRSANAPLLPNVRTDGWRSLAPGVVRGALRTTLGSVRKTRNRQIVALHFDLAVGELIARDCCKDANLPVAPERG